MFEYYSYKVLFSPMPNEATKQAFDVGVRLVIGLVARGTRN